MREEGGRRFLRADSAGAGVPPKPAGIAVLTDADDTRSRAAGDYANFLACR